LIINQITDPHIAAETERPFGKDTRDLFLKSLEFQKRERPDLLVVTGDLCFREGEEETYLWIVEQLDKLSVPYRVLPGNHDRPSTLARAFKMGDHLKNSGELYFDEIIDGYQFIYTDSSAGEFSSEQWDWLYHRCLQDDRFPKLLFTHHPPLRGEVPYMDNEHPFRQWGLFEEFIEKTRTPISVFCGHYHTEKSLLRPGVSVFITPSPFFGIDDRYQDFEEAITFPCYRRIQLRNGELSTSVFYNR